MSRFSEHFGITRGVEDDWFDIVVSADTPFYVDPFLMFEDEDARWSGAHQDMVQFFALAAEYVRLANGNHESVHWQKAVRMLTFPEPKEMALGLAMGHPEGSGTGGDLAERMADALELLNRANIRTVDHVELFGLFCDGLGVDRLSDVFCNIVKARLIEYTQEIADRHSMALADRRVRHTRWSRENGRWVDERLLLPPSPAFDGAILLCPARFLKDIPRVTAEGFWSWAETNEAETLRKDLNYDLGTTMTIAERRAAARRLARFAPEAARAYVDVIAEQDHEPYPIDADPDLKVGWQEVGAQAASRLSRLEQPDLEDFQTWVRDLMLEFKQLVEETDLWRALWDDELRRPRQERIVQAIASAMWVSHCRASDVDLSKEANIGRGPVDFKFSKGWTRRALTEVKLIKSRKFVDGAEKQLPQYLKSERISCGFYLCVGFTDDDFDPRRLATVEAAATALSEQTSVTIEPIFVDARPKESASKL